MLDELSIQVCKWFSTRGLTHAVVGYSGGIDSTVTALLLNRSGINVHLVVAENEHQEYSSPLGGLTGAEILQKLFELEHIHHYVYPNLSSFHNHGSEVKYFKSRAAFNCGQRSLGDDDMNWIVDEAAFAEAANPIIRNAIFYGVVAALRGVGCEAIVVGTVNFSEAAFLGFWGKSSDAAQDFYPISHLTKRQVYELAKELDVPEEIMNAVPSGDLFYEDTNDHEMIGATYEQIEEIIDYCEFLSLDRDNPVNKLPELFGKVDDLRTFRNNISKNTFKYELPFPGFHLDDRLERFRQTCYPMIRRYASSLGVYVTEYD